MEGFNQRAFFKERMDDISLDPFALSVDNPNLSESLLLTFPEIIFQQEGYLFRKKGVEIDPVFNGNVNGFHLACCEGSPLPGQLMPCLSLNGFQNTTECFRDFPFEILLQTETAAPFQLFFGRLRHGGRHS